MNKYVSTAFFVILFMGFLIVVIVCWTSFSGWKETPVDPPFWKTGVVYQVYPRSFQDTDGDGTGDLLGIASRADYLRDLGVGTVWISPVYESPMKDFGYDISDYLAVDPTFGSLDDFDYMVSELHKRGLKVVMDFVPNHSSDQHKWFKMSEERKGDFMFYYLWADAKGLDANNTPIPPNNWISAFRDSAWEWSDVRQQFYYHQFLKEQPDLNYNSQLVRHEMEAVLRFWLDRGVDGFRIDALKYLFEVEDLSLDEPVAVDSGTNDPNDPAYLNHTYTTNLPSTFLALHRWRDVVMHYGDKVLMVEVYNSAIEDVMKYYGNETVSLADFPFNFFLLDNLKNRSELTGDALKNTISLWLQNMPEGKWPNWVLGNHDNERVATRLGRDLVDALNMLLLLLPGTPVTYYGEEIGMINTYISWEETQDPEGCHWGPDHYQEHSRDPARTPMQWSGGHMAGFTNGSRPWLTINPNYTTINVAQQQEAAESSLKVYQSLTRLRQEATFMQGALTFPFIDQHTFSFIRSLEGAPSYMVVVNTAQKDRRLDLHLGANFQLPDEATVHLRSSTDDTEENIPGSVVDLRALYLMSGEGLVLQLLDD